VDDGISAKPADRHRRLCQYLLKNRPEAKIAVLSQNDDFGKDYVKALRSLGARAGQ
jgi:branched-chain amino acid transport system substrate-binding protein